MMVSLPKRPPGEVRRLKLHIMPGLLPILGRTEFPVRLHGLDQARAATLGMSLLMGARGLGALLSSAATIPPSGPQPGSPLARWHQRIRERPSVAATFAEFDAAAAGMAGAAAQFTAGGRRREYRDHRLEWMVKSGGIEVVIAGLRNNTIRFPWPDPA